MLEWLQEHEAKLWWLAGASVAAFAAAMALVPWMILRIPPDYFAGRRRPDAGGSHGNVLARAVFILAKNALGTALVLAGVLMLLLPGQGVLTILLGLSLMDFPGKFRIERWIVSRAPALRLINRFRRSRGRADLVLNDEHFPSEVPVGPSQ